MVAASPLAAGDQRCQQLVFVDFWRRFGILRRCFRETGQVMAASETELMLRGYGLTTAELYYRMPDYRNVLNSFIWQGYDLAPDYPKLFQFIEFWQEKIEGPLHSVRFTHRKLIGPGEWRNVVGEFGLH
jgi:uncharacterized protein Usg